ncbi:MAG: ComEC/Rec2 family competence protein [Anaerolineales bacterium]|jgi:competence protein ComEC
MTLFWLGVAWLAGIAAGRMATLVVWQWLVLTGLASAAMIVFWRWRGWHLWFACLAMAALGASRLQAKLPTIDDNHIAHYNDSGRYATLMGVVVDYPDVRDTYVGLRVDVDSVRLSGEAWKPSHGRVLVRAPRFGTYTYGDRLSASGFLDTPPEFEDFSYREYLARQGVHSLMNRASVERLGIRQANPFMQIIFDSRSRALETVHALFPDPEASLLAGILLGIESGISQEVRDEFNATGTTHIIAISGFNITIVAGLFVSLLGRWLGARRGAIAAGVAILVYTLFVGADAAVVRAAIMGGLALLARRLGRENDALTALAASAMVMTAVNPLILWDVGFQLSFAATLGLMLYGERLHQAFVNFSSRWLPTETAERLARPVSEFVLFTLAAQVTTLPLMALHFNRISLVSLFANPVILPLQPAVMVLGGLAVIVGGVWLPLGQLVALVAWPAVAFTIRSVSFFAKWPSASIALGQVGVGLIVTFYLFLFGATAWTRLNREWRPRLPRLRLPTAMGLAALAMATAMSWKVTAGLPDGLLHVTFLDVGMGDATLIETPNGRFVLVDGGESPLALGDALGRRLPLLHRSMDWILVAGTDDDQVGGLAGVVERFSVGGALLAGPPGGSAYRRLIETFHAQGVAITRAETGMAMDLGAGAWLGVAHVGERGAVFLIEYGRARVLLCPGADPELVHAMMRDASIGSVSAVLLACGGCEAANPRPWLDHLDPWVTLISVNAGNREGLPSVDVLDALAGRTVLRTDEHGWIELTTDGERFWVEVERQASLGESR